MTIQPGTRLGPYEIVASIGAGGMGKVRRETGFIESPAISPDRTHVALEYAKDGVQEIRDYEIRRGIATSVHKSDITGRQIWTPHGRGIVFALQTEPGKSDIVKVSADGTGDVTTLVKGDHYATPYSQHFLVLTGEQYRPTSATALVNWFQKPAAE